MFKLTPTHAALLLVSLGLGACTTVASGPTYNVFKSKPANGLATYLATCQGVFEGHAECVRAAQDVCSAQSAQATTVPDQPADGRAMFFQCGVAAAAQKPPAPEIAPAPVVVELPPPPPQAGPLTGHVHFATGKAALRADAVKELSALSAQAQNKTFSQAHVNGYTDSTGSEKLNASLSDARAKVTADYLSQHGVKAQMWTVEGQGAADPISNNKTPKGRAENRRATVQLDP